MKNRGRMKYFGQGSLANIILLGILPLLMAQTALADVLPTPAPTMNPESTWLSPTPTVIPATPVPVEPYPAPVYPYPAPELQQGAGNCQNGWIAKDEDAPFEYHGDEIITKVIVKSGLGCFVFLRDGSNGCYTISGIGTMDVTARRTGEASPSCQEISHVEFYSGPPIPTQTFTPTPTDGVITRNTPTATNATPFKFWTFTPPPSGTPTPPTATMTLPPNVTLTATPPDTLPPPPPRMTKTPPFTLPETGQGNDGLGTEELQWFFIVVFVGILFFLILRGMRKPTDE